MPKVHKTNIPDHYIIECPGCECGHIFDQRWTFNGDFEKPTFRPSLLCNKSITEAIVNEFKTVHRCHSYVTDGQIQYLDDCTHNLRGQTVELPDTENPAY